MLLRLSLVFAPTGDAAVQILLNEVEQVDGLGESLSARGCPRSTSYPALPAGSLGDCSVARRRRRRADPVRCRFATMLWVCTAIAVVGAIASLLPPLQVAKAVDPTELMCQRVAVLCSTTDECSYPLATRFQIPPSGVCE
ncbi:hypothetical protein OIE68_19530 [Nocardia vinacea]|uniref:Uncharacterized protein n=1 Tax=Nocardia vinacea TaxID=96468 RepID=A0ABZ1YWQ0_9NOCA|nr:hypothetical protein OIE68_19530 [Nocardia vinacea]